MKPFRLWSRNKATHMRDPPTSDTGSGLLILVSSNQVSTSQLQSQGSYVQQEFYREMFLKSLGQACLPVSYSHSSVIQRFGSQFQFFVAMHRERLAYIRVGENISHSALAASQDAPTPGLEFLSATDQNSVAHPGIFLAFPQCHLETQRKTPYSMNPVPGLQYKILITSPIELRSGHSIQDKIECILLRTLMSINCGFHCRYSLNSQLNYAKDKIVEVKCRLF